MKRFVITSNISFIFVKNIKHIFGKQIELTNISRLNPQRSFHIMSRDAQYNFIFSLIIY